MVLRERRRDRQRDKQNSTCQGKKVELFARNMKMEARTKGKKMFELRKFGLATLSSFLKLLEPKTFCE